MLLAFALIFAPAAMGAKVTYNYDGVVTEATGIFAGQGDRVSGTFTFDDGLVDSTAGTPYLDAFRSWTPESNLTLASGFTASITVGSTTVSEAAEQNHQLSEEALLVLGDGSAGTADTIDYQIRWLSTGVSSLRLFASDPSGTGLSAGSGNLTNSIDDAITVLDNIDFSLFEPGDSYWVVRAGPTSNTVIGEVWFDWTSVSRASVPVVVPTPGEIVTFHVDGAVTSLSDPNGTLGAIFGSIDIGDPMSSTFTFDSKVPDTSADDPTIGTYYAISSYTVTIAGSSVSMPLDATRFSISVADDYVDPSDGVYYDEYGWRSGSAAPSPATDPLSAAVILSTSGSDPPTLITSLAIPLVPPSPNEYELAIQRVLYRQPDGTLDSVRASITSFSVVSRPASPASICLPCLLLLLSD